MGFEILIETWEIEGRINGMIETLKIVPVPAELTNWQTDDMKRKYPETETLSATSASTRIYPRGRPMRMIKSKAPRRAKPLLRGRAVRIARGSGTNRPILRPELFDRLQERMREMLQREVKW